MPEREAHPGLYAALRTLCRALGGREGAWEDAYFAFECMLLEAAGFRLDLTTCAAGGPAHDLYYVSPKTGRAVGRGPVQILRRYVGDGAGGFAVEDLGEVRFVPLLDGVAREL